MFYHSHQHLSVHQPHNQPHPQLLKPHHLHCPLQMALVSPFSDQLTNDITQINLRVTGPDVLPQSSTPISSSTTQPTTSSTPETTSSPMSTTGPDVLPQSSTPISSSTTQPTTSSPPETTSSPLSTTGPDVLPQSSTHISSSTTQPTTSSTPKTTSSPLSTTGPDVLPQSSTHISSSTTQPTTSSTPETASSPLSATGSPPPAFPVSSVVTGVSVAVLLLLIGLLFFVVTLRKRNKTQGPASIQSQSHRGSSDNHTVSRDVYVYEEVKDIPVSDAGASTVYSTAELPTNPSEPSQTLYGNVQLSTNPSEPSQTVSTYTTVNFSKNADSSTDAVPTATINKENDSCDYATVKC
ncbi:flocculation protein FLO11-like [Pygocentrus nattereri]|uniref:flocculation protein FLO11-like n=1 Tax=Pygocentrus nattereri TaxID=42514 RepID=UPI001891B8CA|nr:flocculation protein FLO11-like [Pygocentrus nattereri]